MKYLDAFTEAMTWLGEQPNTLFIGQQVRYPGNALFTTLQGVPDNKKIEMPVAEEMQLGMSIGLALTGKTVISIFPRMDFLMCAMNQLVNHLDKDIYQMPGRVIIRTCIGSTKPMHPGKQHCGDYCKGLRELLTYVRLIQLERPYQIVTAYMYAYGALVDRPSESAGAHWHNSIMVEYGDLYQEES